MLRTWRADRPAADSRREQDLASDLACRGLAQMMQEFGVYHDRQSRSIDDTHRGRMPNANTEEKDESLKY